MLKESAKLYYESHRISFANLADVSENVLGQKVTVDQLKKWSQEDAGWQKASIGGDEKVKFIADLLFEKIETEADELSAKDLVALADSYLRFATKAPDKTTEDAKPTMQQIIDTVHALDSATDSGSG